jgi:hypothetical protein
MLDSISVEAEVRNHFTNVYIDPTEVLDELSTEDIEEYLSQRDPVFQSPTHYWDYNLLADAYYHGDFDLKKFLTDIKKDNLVKLL